MAAIYAREKNVDNLILVGVGLKMQNSQKNQPVAKQFEKLHNAIHYLGTNQGKYSVAISEKHRQRGDKKFPISTISRK